MNKRNHRRSGFIIFFGWRVITTREFGSQIRGCCSECGKDEARLIGRVRRRWFTLFFIPVVPIESAEQGVRFSQCRECGHLFDVPIEQLARRAGRRSTNFSDTIVVYNQLRDQPGNGQLLLKLMQMYQDLGELAEAETATRHFPQALQNEPACNALLQVMRASQAS